MGPGRRHRRPGLRSQRPHGSARHANQLARAFYAVVYATPHSQANLARFHFLDPASRRFYPDWGQAADVAVAILRTKAGRNPHDKDLHDLVGELSTRSDDFRTRWGAHNVRHHGTGTKRFHHHAVGDLTLAYEGLEMAAEPASPASPAEEGLRLLASWGRHPGRRGHETLCCELSPVLGGRVLTSHERMRRPKGSELPGRLSRRSIEQSYGRAHLPRGRSTERSAEVPCVAFERAV